MELLCLTVVLIALVIVFIIVFYSLKKIVCTVLNNFKSHMLNELEPKIKACCGLTLLTEGNNVVKACACLCHQCHQHRWFQQIAVVALYQTICKSKVN